MNGTSQRGAQTACEDCCTLLLFRCINQTKQTETKYFLIYFLLASFSSIFFSSHFYSRSSLFSSFLNPFFFLPIPPFCLSLVFLLLVFNTIRVLYPLACFHWLQPYSWNSEIKSSKRKNVYLFLVRILIQNKPVRQYEGRICWWEDCPRMYTCSGSSKYNLHVPERLAKSK